MSPLKNIVFVIFVFWGRVGGIVAANIVGVNFAYGTFKEQ